MATDLNLLLILFCILFPILGHLVVGFYLNYRLSSLSLMVEETAARLNNLPTEEFDPLLIIAEVKAGIEDVVADTLENLEPPRAIDHVFGAVAQLIQMKAMGAMNMLPQGVADMAEQVMGQNQENV